MLMIFNQPEYDAVPVVVAYTARHLGITGPAKFEENESFSCGIVEAMTVHSSSVPFISVAKRVKVKPLGHEFYQVDVYYGLKDERNIPHALELCNKAGLQFDMMETSFFIARQTVLATLGAGMALWREVLFAAMARNARDAAEGSVA